jgi:hypothetical protein
MFYQTRLDENTTMIIEAEVGGAFAKSDLEVRPDPDKALVNLVDVASTFAKYIATEFNRALSGQNAEAEVSFAVKADSFGMVMVGMKPNEGQLQCTLRFGKPGGGGSKAIAAPRSYSEGDTAQ